MIRPTSSRVCGLKQARAPTRPSRRPLGFKALRDEPLPLFASASAREGETVPEIHEPVVALRPMTTGGEVIEDYGHVGLSLRNHPVFFLREELRRKRSITCDEAMQARDGRWVEVAGLVLLRQRPGTAKGVMFITIEDETGIANLIVWPSVYEKQRRIILSAGMLGVRGRVQREGEIVHIIAHWLTDMSGNLAKMAPPEFAISNPIRKHAGQRRRPQPGSRT